MSLVFNFYPQNRRIFRPSGEKLQLKIKSHYGLSGLAVIRYINVKKLFSFNSS